MFNIYSIVLIEARKILFNLFTWKFSNKRLPTYLIKIPRMAVWFTLAIKRHILWDIHTHTISDPGEVIFCYNKLQISRNYFTKLLYFSKLFWYLINPYCNQVLGYVFLHITLLSQQCHRNFFIVRPPNMIWLSNHIRKYV